MAVRKLRDETENTSMGERLRYIRVERNMSLKELGARVGVAYQQIQKYETGQNTMTVPAMKQIASALEVPACEICGCCDD
jgi:transcriptional regulator with XRE-family HTH domain